MRAPPFKCWGEGSEPTSVLDNPRSPSTCTSTSSLGGGGDSGGVVAAAVNGWLPSEWASELQPIPDSLAEMGGLGMEDWEAIFADSAGEVSPISVAEEKPQLLSPASDLNSCELGSFGLVDPGIGAGAGGGFNFTHRNQSLQVPPIHCIKDPIFGNPILPAPPTPGLFFPVNLEEKSQLVRRVAPVSTVAAHHHRNQALLDQLLNAAELVEAGNSVSAITILARLNQQLPAPAGKPLLRSAFYFKEALQFITRAPGVAPPRGLATPLDVLLKLGAYKDFSKVSPLLQFTNFTCTQTLLEELRVFLRVGSKDVVTWTAMISGYEKNGLPGRALEVFEQMKAEEGVIPDEVTVASVLSACASLGNIDIGIEVHKFARENGLMSYTLVGNALIDLYSKSKCVDNALDVFSRMPEKNVISWSSMISGFHINHKSTEALNFFRQMQVDVKPNSVTFIAALSACATLGAVMCGKELHAHALRSGFGREGYLPNAILDMYVKCGRTEYARKMFNAHEDKDVVSWNIMLSCYAAREHGDLAFVLFHQMEEAEVQPDEVTFVALLCACSQSKMVSQGWYYFNNMDRKHGVTPNLKHYACMVDLLGRVGRLEDAHQLIKDMPLVADAAIWGALLNGCRINHRIELGELAARRIFELEPHSVGYHVLLCNLYADDGRWDQVVRVRNLMRERGLMVDPGCSWIEVKGAIHAFLSGDESHPQFKEIDAVLNGLYDRIKAAGYDLSDGIFSDEIEASKADIFCGHSERPAITFGLINSTPGTPIWVTKNLFMCASCHATVKLITRIVRREITVRDTEMFHCFKDGKCSCGDERYSRKNNVGMELVVS